MRKLPISIGLCGKEGRGPGKKVCKFALFYEKGFEEKVEFRQALTMFRKRGGGHLIDMKMLQKWAYGTVAMSFVFLQRSFVI